MAIMTSMMLPVICPSCSAAFAEAAFPDHWKLCKPPHWSRKGDVPSVGPSPAIFSVEEATELEKALTQCEEAGRMAKSNSSTVAFFLNAVFRHRFGGVLGSSAEVTACGPETFAAVTTSLSLTYRFEAPAFAPDRVFLAGFAKHLECILPLEVTIQGSTIVAQPNRVAYRDISAAESSWSLLVQHAPMVTEDVLLENCSTVSHVALSDDETAFMLTFRNEQDMLDVLAKGSIALRSKGQHSHAVLKGMPLSTQRCSVVAQSTIVINFEPSWEPPLSRLISSSISANPNVHMVILFFLVWLRTEVIFVRPLALSISPYHVSLMVLYALFRMRTVEWPGLEEGSDAPKGPSWKLTGVLKMARRVFDFYGSPDTSVSEDALEHAGPFAWESGEVVQVMVPVRAYARKGTTGTERFANTGAQEHRLMLCCAKSSLSSDVSDIAADWPEVQTKRLRDVFSRGRRMFYGGQLAQQLQSFALKAMNISEAACVTCGGTNPVIAELRGPRQRCAACTKSTSNAGVLRQALKELAQDEHLILSSALMELLDRL